MSRKGATNLPRSLATCCKLVSFIFNTSSICILMLATVDSSNFTIIVFDEITNPRKIISIDS